MNQQVIWEELGHPPEAPPGKPGRKRIGTNKFKGYRAPPGTGPEGQTCGTCKFKVRKPGMAGHYLKCLLMQNAWTGGAGTDIKARSPACREWVPENWIRYKKSFQKRKTEQEIENEAIEAEHNLP